MDSKQISLSKFISLILRHKPEAAGIVLDENGWADAGELIAAICRTGKTIDRALLEKIVREDAKGRYSFDETGKKIRANQGHSVDVHIEMPQMLPPPQLYHGTAEKFLPAIMREGIRKMSRRFVHLSADGQTALSVGSRRGPAAVLVIDTQKMAEDGYVFFLSSNGVWQSEDIPPQYISDIRR